MSDGGFHPMLLIDCSQRQSVLGLAVRDERDVGSVVIRTFAVTTHAEREAFWDELRALTAEARLAPSDLRCVAVATGPGGFTGLRVSIAVAQALALAHGIPVVPVPSASLFSASDEARGGRGPWLVALAAKGATAWATVVERPTDASAQGAVVDLESFAALCEGVARRGGALLADEHLDSQLAECANRLGLSRRTPKVDGSAFAVISEEIRASRGGVRPAALLPIYAREPEAVTNWRLRADLPPR